MQKKGPSPPTLGSLRFGEGSQGKGADMKALTLSGINHIFVPVLAPGWFAGLVARFVADQGAEKAAGSFSAVSVPTLYDEGIIFSF